MGEYHFGSVKKPPLGVMPRDIYERNCKVTRLNAIAAAISRYLQREMKVPVEWIQEYNELAEEINL